MNINRDNYEEFFILYGDNELGSEDRIRVESFVLENPDLQSEFSALNQVRFTPDEEISFDQKETLMQTAGISRNEELLLLAVDHELTPAQQTELNDLLSRDKTMQAELDLYKQTAFDPNERIVFPYKESLYRREEKARVIPFAWRRFAAAAAILVAVSVTAFIVFTGKDKPADGVAQVDGAGTKGAGQTGEVADGKDNVALDGKQNDASDNKDHLTPAGQDQLTTGTGNTASVKKDSSMVAPHYGHGHELPVSPSGSVAVKKENKKVSAPVQYTQPAGEKEQVAKTHNNLPQPLYNPNVKETAGNAQLAVNTPAVKQTTASANQINTDKPVTLPSDDPYKLVVNKMPDPGDETDDQGPSSRKSKFRGFFRKVTRTFEKNTNIKATDEEDRLLVGGLAIRL